MEILTKLLWPETQAEQGTTLLIVLIFTFAVHLNCDPLSIVQIWTLFFLTIVSTLFILSSVLVRILEKWLEKLD